MLLSRGLSPSCTQETNEAPVLWRGKEPSTLKLGSPFTQKHLLWRWIQWSGLRLRRFGPVSGPGPCRATLVDTWVHDHNKFIRVKDDPDLRVNCSIRCSLTLYEHSEGKPRELTNMGEVLGGLALQGIIKPLTPTWECIRGLPACIIVAWRVTSDDPDVLTPGSFLCPRQRGGQQLQHEGQKSNQ